MVGEPANGRDRGWQAANLTLTPEQYRRGTQMLRIAALLQYTLPGMPCLYYGDEAGLYGYRDPFNRGCYPWGKEDTDLVDFFAGLGQFRRRQSLLAKGEFVPLKGQDCLCYLRVQDDRALLVAVNAAEAPCKVELPQGFVPEGESFAAGQWKEETLTLGDCSGVLLCGRLEKKELTERYCGGNE
jgi:glycosidase